MWVGILHFVGLLFCLVSWRCSRRTPVVLGYGSPTGCIGIRFLGGLSSPLEVIGALLCVISSVVTFLYKVHALVIVVVVLLWSKLPGTVVLGMYRSLTLVGLRKEGRREVAFMSEFNV